jgi:hypothetical protein
VQKKNEARDVKKAKNSYKQKSTQLYEETLKLKHRSSIELNEDLLLLKLRYLMINE